MEEMVSPHKNRIAERIALVRKGGALGIPQCGPMEAGIILTYACNYNCIFCAIEHEPGGIKKPLDKEIALRTIKALAEMGTMQISFTGGGDPLSYPHLDQLIDEVIAGGMECSVCTNAALLDEKKAFNWAEKGIHLSVSFNAADQAMYCKMHPGAEPGDYFRILDMLKQYSTITDSDISNSGFVSMNFVLCSMNYDQIEKMAMVSKSAGATQIQYRVIQPRPVHANLRMNNQQLRLARSQVAEITRQYKDDPSYTIQMPALLLPDNQNDTNGFSCLEGYLSTYIDSNGVVFPCCIMSCGISSHYMGDINDEPIDQIWHGERYSEFRADSNNASSGSNVADDTSCLHCPKARHFKWIAEFKDSKEDSSENDDILRDKPLPETERVGAIAVSELPKFVSPGQTLRITLAVTNNSNSNWPSSHVSAVHSIGAGYHILDGQRKMYRFDSNPRAYLWRDLKPGDSVNLPLEVCLPTQKGNYFLQFDIVQEHVSWFSASGNSTPEIPITVK